MDVQREKDAYEWLDEYEVPDYSKGFRTTIQTRTVEVEREIEELTDREDEVVQTEDPLVIVGGKL